MAEHLASIYGTEKDRVNCPFYFKIGACRHGDRCSRLHMRPTLSQTILMTNMYENPEYAAATGAGPSLTKAQCQDHFEDFYEDVFLECSRFGRVESVNICENVADHLVGNVYVKFRDEDSALAAKNALNHRYYAKRVIKCEFSPVTDFRESACRQYDERACNRAGYCNFMHLRKVSPQMRRDLFGMDRSRRTGGGDARRDARRDDFERRDDSRKRSRSRSGTRDPEEKAPRRDDGEGGGRRVTAKGMSDEERRGMFAKWNQMGDRPQRETNTDAQ
jgi:splicing factor U2AF subunit